jgi:branched-chain amino acid transport system permease protein
MVAAPFIVGGFGFVLEALIIRRFYAAPIVAMLGTYALGLIIRESVRGLIGGFYLTVPEPIGGSIDLGNMHISAWRFTIIVITLLVMAACYLLLSRTSFGLRVRATLENPALARASGISTPLIYGTTFAFGAALAGLAGALIVPVFSLFADLGIRFLIQGFVAVMVGGVGSFIGPVAGAGLIGTLSAALPWVMSPVVADVLVFVLAIAFIKFRPQGLISGRGV